MSTLATAEALVWTCTTPTNATVTLPTRTKTANKVTIYVFQHNLYKVFRDYCILFSILFFIIIRILLTRYSQVIPLISVFTKQVDVVIVLDVSGSVENEYKRSLLLVKEIIYGLPMENDIARVGLISFSTKTLVQIFLNRNTFNKHRMIDMIDFYRVVGRTNTPSAFDAFLNNQLGKSGDRPTVPNYVLVFTDGYSNINPSQTIPKATDIRNRGNTVICVAMSDAPNLNEIRGMASSNDYISYFPSSSTPAQVAIDVLNKIAK